MTNVSITPVDLRIRVDPSGREQIELKNEMMLYVTAVGINQGMTFEVLGGKEQLFILNDAIESFI